MPAIEKGHSVNNQSQSHQNYNDSMLTRPTILPTDCRNFFVRTEDLHSRHLKMYSSKALRKFELRQLWIQFWA